jgi:hypothetical protein
LIESLTFGEATSALLSDLQPDTSLDKQFKKIKFSERAIIEFIEEDWSEAKRREKLIQHFIAKHYNEDGMHMVFVLNIVQLANRITAVLLEE